MLKHLHNKKGFTLVETMVTLVLVGILLAGSVAGVNAYVDYSNYKTNNEYARTLFMTVQSSLAYSKASGALSSMRATLGGDAAQAVPDAINDNYEDRLQYILIKNGDMSGADGEVLRELIGDYVFDEDVFNATICVELDLTDGVAHSVLYSKQATDFSYAGGGTDPYGTLSIATDAREYSSRRRTLLGYYDSDLPNREPSSYGKPSISYVKLDNNEALDLRWALTRKYKIYTSDLYYTVELYDENNVKRLSLLVNSNTSAAARLVRDTGKPAETTLSCAYEAFASNGTASGTGELTLPAYVTSDYEVHLILDIVDYVALGDADTDYTGTWSAMRLSELCGDDFKGDIYARVKAAGAQYAASAAKQSNTENMFLGKKNGSGVGYTLQNARHLFNLRFTASAEEPGDYANNIYTQTASFAWGGNAGLLAHNYVVDSVSKTTKTTSTAFPAIDVWPAGSKLTASGVPTIGSLILRSETGKDGTALFLRNLGEAEKLIFADVDVEGGDYTAVFAARNGEQGKGNGSGNNAPKPGIINEITVKSGTVKGDDHVGGITAEDESISQTFTGLVNGADITGKSYVGGVMGSGSQAKNKQASQGPSNAEYSDTGALEKCKNTGAVRGTGEYIGGIIGCNFGKSITECTSAPKGAMEEVQSDDLKGKYVGGIVGFNINGSITKCSTGEGVVCGKEYVGGIVGLDLKLGELSGGGARKGRSQVDVIGETYVGGIAGANVVATATHANMSDNNTDFTVATDFTGIYDITQTEAANQLIISDWSNEGLVCATKQYSGGITGYNCGLIEDCNSNVNISSASGESLLEKMERLGSTGDCAGGIAGCNRGMITNATEQNLVSVVAGKDYVGGIAGFNAATGRVENCKISGGYISGRCFVGGYAGLNCSRSMYQTGDDTTTALYSSPNLVRGGHYVGGVFGGSIIRTYAYAQSPTSYVYELTSLRLSCNANNFLGSITANGLCAGGFIGYHALLNAELTDGATELPEGWLDIDDENLGRRLAKAVDDVEGDYDVNSIYFDAYDRQQMMQDIVAKLDDIAEDVAEDTDSTDNKATLYIGSESDALVCRLHDIQGYAYVGGVIGYNSPNTKLTITNVQNRTPITATGYLTEGNDTDTHYSYAGGIIGRASEYTVIDKCVNASSATVTHKGTYAGGLVEVNEGTVKNCKSAGWSQPDRNWMGGLVGLNRIAKDASNADEKHSGYIVDCELTGDLTGGEGTGGIAAENRGGIIEDVIVSGNVNGRGNITGGVVAKNTGSITDATVNENVISTGDRVGGIAGENGGSISSCTVAATSTVQGNECVGGFIGYQINSTGTITVSGLTNSATVTGEDQVGGIVGYIEGAALIENCQNKSTVTANAGMAGGITAYNGENSTIRNCVNSANIYAPMSLSNGGICARNAGTVEGSSVKLATGAAAGSVITITGQQDVGGIAGQNTGTVKTCTIGANVTVTNREGGTAGNVGGIVGYNNGTASKIEACTTEARIAVNSLVGGGTLGGIAGNNEGSITGAAAISTFNAAVTLNTGLEGYTGGIAGWNTGAVQNYTFAGKVTADGGESYGYGCIVGVNGNDGGTAAASISNCFVDDGVARELNDTTNTDSTDYTLHTSIKGNVRAGGITGLNCKNATVTASSLANCYLRGDYGYVGGVAGQNFGSVSGCTAPVTDANVPYKVKVYMYQGDVGGIVGRNEQTGTVNDCATGSDWVVLAARLNSSNTKEGTDNTCGGVMGYNCSDSSMQNLKNYARVRKSLSGASEAQSFIAAGIIGRNENITSSGWTYTGFENYGSITGGYRTAGIIGQWKYNGGTLKDCVNEGTINGYQAVGGMVGATYGLIGGQRVYVIDCINHGNVNASNGNAGGMFGHVQHTSNAVWDLTLLGCVNTGNITSSNAGGMIGNSDKFKGTEVIRCVNYYPFTTQGAISGTTSWVNMFSCINVPTVANPTAAGYTKGVTNANYYLANEGIQGTAGTQAIKLIVKEKVEDATKLAAYDTRDQANVIEVIPELPYDPNTAEYSANTARQNYNELHEYLVIAFKNMFAGEPVKPEGVVLTGSEGGYNVKWNASANAYYYTVTVETYNAETEEWEKEEPIKVYGDTQLDFTADPAWAGRQMRVAVAACNSADESSDAGYSGEMLVRTPLLEPSVCYELTADGSFVFRLLNKADYEAAYALDELENIQINAVFGSKSATFTAASGVSSAITTTSGSGGAVYMSASAKPSGTLGETYLESVKNNVQTHDYGTGTLAGTQLSSMSNAHFTGIRPSELSFVLTLNSSGNKQLYRRTEFVVNDAELGVDVAIASDTTRISGSHVITLVGLDEVTGGQDIKVRSYSWGTQNFAEMFGHEVKKNVAKAELGTLIDEMNGGVRVYNNDDPENKTLAPGYVLARNADGTYNVLYSVFLAKETTYQKQVLYSSIVKAPEALAAPVLNADYIDNSADARGYRFGWDQAANAQYEVAAYGLPAGANAETETGWVSIRIDPAAASTTNNYIDLDPANWAYKTVRIKVTRLGTQTNGTTAKLGSTGTREYTVPLALPRMGAPVVSFHTADRNNVTYDVSWVGQTGLALADTEKYELYIKRTAEPEAVPTLLETIDDPETTSVNVDLEAYQDEEVTMYVNSALAASPTNFNRNSIDGAPATLTVERRIRLSENFAFELSSTYADNASVSVSDFTNGLVLTASAPDTADSGSYILEAAVYDSPVLNADGAPTGTWLYEIASGTNMVQSVSNSLTEPSTYALANLPAEYAGQYLVARARAVSGSMVSSLWSAYSAFQLPRVQLDKPAAEQSDTTLEQALLVKNADDEYEQPTEGDNTVDVKRQAISWTWDKNAAGYDLALTELGTNAVYTLELRNDALNGFTLSVTEPPTGEDQQLVTTIIQRTGDDVDGFEFTVPQYEVVLNASFTSGAQYRIACETKLTLVPTAQPDGTTAYVCTLLLPDIPEYTIGSEEFDNPNPPQTFMVSIIAEGLDATRFDASAPRIWRRTAEPGGNFLYDNHGFDDDDE